MKEIRVIAVVIATLVLLGCGGSSARKSEDVVVWRDGKPVAIADQGPPPSKLIVKDIEIGSGRTLTDGRTATLRYRNFDYRSGQRYEDWWDQPFVTGFGKGESLGAWETGLKGMRVGGRRELIVPAKEAYGRVPQIYVLELTAVR